MSVGLRRWVFVEGGGVGPTFSNVVRVILFCLMFGAESKSVIS